MTYSESVEDVMDDAARVFGYDPDAYYSERAHAYLVERRVNRSYDDTAVLCVVRDLIKRASDAACGEDSGLRERMVSAATDLLGLAREMGA